MSFDPNAHMPPPQKIEEPLTVPGKFLVAFVHVKRARESEGIYGRTPNGNDFVTFKSVVIGGKPSGESGKIFWPDIFINANSYKRLASMMRAMNFLERFDLTDEVQLKGAMLYRPFVAQVKTRRHNDRVYCDIGFTEEMSSEFEKAAAAWLAKDAGVWRERAQRMSEGRGGQGRDDFGGETSRGAGGSNPFPNDDGAPDFDDGDIPF